MYLYGMKKNISKRNLAIRQLVEISLELKNEIERTQDSSNLNAMKFALLGYNSIAFDAI